MERRDTDSVKKVWNNQTVKIVAILVLAVGIGLGFFFYRTNYAVASTIWLNGDLGIEIKVNQKEKVLEVKAKDAAAQAIVGGTDFRGSQLDVTIDALLGAMMRNGYWKDGMNPITVRVESKDWNRAQELQKELTEDVNELMQTNLFQDTKLSQTELTEEEAKSIALSHAAVSEEAVVQYFAKLDYENGIMVYEIEFYADGYEYDYDINAITGEIVSQKKEIDDHYASGNHNGTGTHNEIENHNETTHNEIENHNETTHNGMENHNETTHNGIEYHNETTHNEIENHNETTHNGIEYHSETGTHNGTEYHSGTGTHNGTEYHSGTGTQGGGVWSNTGTEIGEEQAKAAAFSHAKVSADNVWVEKCALDYEDGIMVYEIEFYSGGYEYDYDINAATGEVVSFKKEVDDSVSLTNQNTGTGNSTSYIGEAKAREIALTRAGLSGGSGSVVEIELDQEDGIMVYEVEIKSGGYEYKCEINAITGEIVSYEKEWED